MLPPRRRTLGEDEEGDITHGLDLEKRSGYTTRDSSIDADRSASSYTSSDSMLFHNSHHPPRRRISRGSSIFYRLPNRTVRWLCFALMSTIILFMLSLVRMSYKSGEFLEAHRNNKPPPPLPWEQFHFLRRYYGGLRTLTALVNTTPEFPNDNETPALDIHVNVTRETAKPLQSSQAVLPYPEYSSSAYLSRYEPVKECFLDDWDTVRIPHVQAYSGVVEGFPLPLMGSYDLIGVSSSMCYDRYGKLGPYGYGYSKSRGGTGAGLDGEREGAENVFKTAPPVDYSKVRWADAQERCLQKNKQRFLPETPIKAESFRDMHVARAEVRGSPSEGMSTSSEDSSGKESSIGSLNKAFSSLDTISAESSSTGSSSKFSSSKDSSSAGSSSTGSSSKQKLARTAVVIRIWNDYEWTQEAIVYMRSIIGELSILSGAEYQVHFLIHVKDVNQPIWSSEAAYNATLEKALPAEFQGMGTLWSERQMELIYGGLQETGYRGLPVYGVYRSAHFALQYFAHKHPEYEYFWNWEMDIRYTGHWYKLFESLRSFAQSQPRKGLWERNGRFYIPSIHGSWDEFRTMVRVQSEMAPPQTSKWANIGPSGLTETPPSDRPVWGPLAPNETVRFDSDPIPPSTYEKDHYEWGVGEEADLITLNPLFDPERTGWLLNDDCTGYDTKNGQPPRRTAIITASRLSRRLLLTMHEETGVYRHTMFSEMWPASAALHHGLKAVYAPHPVFIDRAWPPAYAAKVFNGGYNGASGGARTSVFANPLEHNFRGVTWYYNAGFPVNLYRRWLGMRVDGNGGEAKEIEMEGRMCVPGMLMHPVKEFDFVVEEPEA